MSNENNLVRAVLDEEGEGTADQIEREEAGEGGEVHHLYLLTEDQVQKLLAGETEETIVDSVASEEAPTPITLSEQQESEPGEREIPQTLPKHRRVKPALLLVPLMLLVLFSIATLSYVFVLPGTASATIIITPFTKTVHQEASLRVATHPHASQVQGRPLQSMSLTKSITVSATGHAHQDALPATGVITFYNADSQTYTIPAGMTFTTSSGTTIVTESVVTVQAAVPPLFGQGIVAAHAVQPGAAGNIPARSISTKCCGSVYVTATNVQAFTGGQDERNYTYIQSSDIANAEASLLPPLTTQVTARLAKQARPGEQLVPPQCSPHMTSSGKPGEEARTVTVSVTQTCTSVLYSLDSLERVGTAFLTQSQNLTAYQQVGEMQVTIHNATSDHQTALLQVTLRGVWMYRFSQSQLQHVKRMIAGVSKQKAQTILQSQEGIQQVTVSLTRFDFSSELPRDTAHIHIVFIVS